MALASSWGRESLGLTKLCLKRGSWEELHLQPEMEGRKADVERPTLTDVTDFAARLSQGTLSSLQGLKLKNLRSSTIPHPEPAVFRGGELHLPSFPAQMEMRRADVQYLLRRRRLGVGVSGLSTRGNHAKGASGELQGHGREMLKLFFLSNMQQRQEQQWEYFMKL